MRALTIVVVAAATLWGGWWFVAARAAEKGARAWFAGLAEQGLQGSHDGISVLGFPNRVDLTITAPSLADPARGVGWQSPFVQVFALTYRPWHLIAAVANSQSLRTPAGSVTVTTDSARASLVLRPQISPDLDRLTVVLENPSLTPSDGGLLRAEQVRAALRSAPPPAGSAVHAATGAQARYQVGLAAEGLRLDGEAMAWIGPSAARLPAYLRMLRLDAYLHLTSPLGIPDGSPPPRLAAIEIAAARLEWGSLVVSVGGIVAPDADGRAEGSLEVAVEDWPAALGLARRAGLVAPDEARALEALLTGLAPPDRDGGRIAVPLRLAGGKIRLGPLVLGQAPRF